MVSNSVIGAVGLGLALLVGSKYLGSNRNSSLPEVPSLPQAEDNFNFAPALTIRDQISSIFTKLTAQRADLVQEAQEIRDQRLFHEGFRVDRSTAQAIKGEVSFNSLSDIQKRLFLMAQANDEFNYAKEPFIEANINPNIALIDQNLSLLTETLNQIPIPSSV